MPRLHAKSFRQPDDVRVMPKVRFETVGLDDTAWRDLLAAHNGRMRELLNVYRGREVKTTGDGLLATFDSPTRAVQCAAGMIGATRAIGVEIRAGLHTGDVELIGDDVRGIAVHTATRILALAGPGEVLLSSTTAGLIEGSGIAVGDAGSHELNVLSGSRLSGPVEA